MTVSVAENANAGAGSVVAPAGPETTSGAAGGVRSTVNGREAGEASTLPEASLARTASTCAPSASAAVVNGVAHAAKLPAVERALERHARLVGREREGRRRVVRRAFRAGFDRRARRRRVDRDRPRARLARVAGGVDRAHGVGVRAVAHVGQRDAPVPACRDRRAAQHRALADLDRRARLGGAGEREGRRREQRPLRGRRDQRRRRRDDVDHERPLRRRSRRCPPRRGRAPRTCGAPAASAAVVCGDVQPAKAAASTRHSNVAPASEENANVGVVSLSGLLGPLEIVVSGAVVSTMNVCVAGLASVLPAASVARTWNVWLPSLSAASVCEDVHAANGALSTRHWNVAPASRGERERRRRVVGRRRDRRQRRVRRGGVDHERLRAPASASVLPAASIARTSKRVRAVAERARSRAATCSSRRRPRRRGTGTSRPPPS